MFKSHLRNPDIETVAFEAMGHLKGAFGLRYGQDEAAVGRAFHFGRDDANRLRRQILQVLRTQGETSRPALAAFLTKTADELERLDQARDDQAAPAADDTQWSHEFATMQTRLTPLVDQVATTIFGDRLADVRQRLHDGEIEVPGLVDRAAIVLGATVPDTPLSQPAPADEPVKPVYFNQFIYEPPGKKPSLEKVALETIGHVKAAFDLRYDAQDDRLFGPKQRQGWQRRIEQALDREGLTAHPAITGLLTQTAAELRALAVAGDDYDHKAEAAQARLAPLADAALDTVFAGKLQQVAQRFQSGTTNGLTREDRLALTLMADRPKTVAAPAPAIATP